MAKAKDGWGGRPPVTKGEKLEARVFGYYHEEPVKLSPVSPEEKKLREEEDERARKRSEEMKKNRELRGQAREKEVADRKREIDLRTGNLTNGQLEGFE